MSFVDKAADRHWRDELLKEMETIFKENDKALAIELLSEYRGEWAVMYVLIMLLRSKSEGLVSVLRTLDASRRFGFETMDEFLEWAQGRKEEIDENPGTAPEAR